MLSKLYIKTEERKWKLVIGLFWDGQPGKQHKNGKYQTNFKARACQIQKELAHDRLFKAITFNHNKPYKVYYGVPHITENGRALKWSRRNYGEVKYVSY